jgi:hypothetical protein
LAGGYDNASGNLRIRVNSGGVVPICDYTINTSPNPLLFQSGGGNGNISINAGSACAWNITGPQWVVLSKLQGVGSDNIQVSVAQNNGGNRVGNIVLTGANNFITNISISQSGINTTTNIYAFQTSSCYTSPGEATISVEFRYVGNLLSLLYRPVLPNGWAITSVTGDGQPEYRNMEIIFVGDLSANPIRFNYRVSIPQSQSGSYAIRGGIEYELSGIASPVSYEVNPSPLILDQCIDRHRADYMDPPWIITGTEANRVLAYWRAGGYRCDNTTADGYAPGSGNLDCGKHTADFREPFGRIDGTEVNRVLAYWRAGGYHRDTSSPDGYAPGLQSWLVRTTLQQIGNGDIIRNSEEDIVASHSTSVYYQPGQLLVVTNEFRAKTNILSLLWRPNLPAGWAVTNVRSLDGLPVSIQAGEILWTGEISTNVVRMTYELLVPAGESGTKAISAEVEYKVVGQLELKSIQPKPFQLLISCEVCITALNIISHPSNIVVAAGQTLWLNVEAVGDGWLNYQWYKGNNVLPGQTNSVLIIINSQFDDSGEYFVVVYNQNNSVTSRVANAVVIPIDRPLGLTGRFYQKVTVMNPAGSRETYPAIRILIRGLTNDSLGFPVRVGNALGNVNGVPYVQYNWPISEGQIIDLSIEYIVLDRRTIPNPSFEVQVVQPVTFPVPQGRVVELHPRSQYTNNMFILYFRSENNKEYYIQYKDSMSDVGWTTVLIPVMGTGYYMQWVDDGPPKTRNVNNSSRFYRVVEK